MQCFLISFQANHIIAILGNYFFYCFLLAAHSIARKNEVLHLNQIKKLRNSGNFITLVIYTDLSEYNSCFICPCTDYMNNAVVIFTTSTNCFSVQTYDFILFYRKYELYPISESLFSILFMCGFSSIILPRTRRKK